MIGPAANVGANLPATANGESSTPDVAHIRAIFRQRASDDTLPGD